MTGPQLLMVMLAINISVKNKFDTLQETFEKHIPNDEYEN